MMEPSNETEDNFLLRLLQGRWLGVPLYAALAKLPVAFWLGALGFDLLSRFGVWNDGGTSCKGAYCLLLAGLLVAVISLPSGYAEWTQIGPDHPARPTARTYAASYFIALGLYCASFFLRDNPMQSQVLRVSTPAFAIGVAAAVMLLSATWVGGSLVFDHGVGVGRRCCCCGKKSPPPLSPPTEPAASSESAT